MMPDRGTELVVGGETVEPGTRKRVDIPIARLPSGTSVALPVIVLRGRREGPGVFLNAAIHGDEIDGLEVILEVLERIDVKSIHGTIIAVPVVNVFGFITASRYLPDRRDLNRSFPGSETGSLAARLAHLFMQNVVLHCNYGIDFHAGSHHRTNLPQIRADLTDPETLRLAEAFGPRIILDAPLRPGSLREAAGSRGIRTLVYEAGEPSRFDPISGTEAVEGTLRVLHAVGLLDKPVEPSPYEPFRIGRSRWVRASRSGILRPSVRLGQLVRNKERLGVVSDIYGEQKAPVRAAFAGIVLGLQLNPLVHRGDALVHIGEPE